MFCLRAAIDLVWSEFGKLFFEEVDSEFDVKFSFFRLVDVPG